VNGVWTAVGLEADWHSDYSEGGVRQFTDAADGANGTHTTELVTKESVRRISSHDSSDPLFLYVAYTAPHSMLTPDEEIVRTRNSHIQGTTLPS